LSTKGSIPYFGLVAVGLHSIPVIKSNGFTSMKNEKELYTSIARIPPNKSKTRNPVPLNINLNTISKDKRVLYFILLIISYVISMLFNELSTFCTPFKCNKRADLLPRFRQYKLVQRTLKKINPLINCCLIQWRNRDLSLLFNNL